jgi:hypothetical protein
VIAESADIDEQTLAYILETQRHFEDLRTVAAQLAGLLVLSAVGANGATPDHPLLTSAEQLYQAATDGIRGARATERASRHHRYLMLAAESLGRALSSARCVEIDPVLEPLRAAYASLQSATRELPGFRVIAFEQGCCALHI